MKNTITLHQARQRIITRVFIRVAIPFVIIAIGRLVARWAFSAELSFFPTGLVLFIMQPIITASIGAFYFKRGDDRKLLAEMQEEERLRNEQERYEREDEIFEYAEEYYKVVAISPVSGVCCAFEIIFSEDVESEFAGAKPHIYVGDSLISYQKAGKNSVTCHLEKHVYADQKDLVIGCFNQELSVKNPYYMNLSQEGIVWQNEGHAHEKLIFIDGSCVPQAHPDVHYSFDLLVGGKFYGTYAGAYDAKQKRIAIGIGNVRKSECAGKTCVIRPTFDKRQNVTLPKPKVLSINGSPVAKVV